MASSAGLPPLGPDRAPSSSGLHIGGRPPLRPCHPHPAHATPGCVMVESVDDAEGLYVAVERCPLCSTSRRRLTCARCVQAGDFVYFDGRNTERFGTGSSRYQPVFTKAAPSLLMPDFIALFGTFTAALFFPQTQNANRFYNLL